MNELAKLETKNPEIKQKKSNLLVLMFSVVTDDKSLQLWKY